MVIKQDYPPNIEEIKKHFKIRHDVVYTYGDTLYSPQGANIPKHLMIHEETHSKEQLSLTPELWWKKYFEDPTFRLEQELMAYKNQLNSIRKDTKNWSKMAFYTAAIARDLSSELYGNIISFEGAVKKLQ